MNDCLELVPVTWLYEDDACELQHGTAEAADAHAQLTDEVVGEVGDPLFDAYGNTLKVMVGLDGLVTIALQ
jgi:hypothetical protein